MSKIKVTITLLLILVILTTTNAQTDSSFQRFQRSFLASFNSNGDTCTNITLLLKMTVDKNFHVELDKFSDNAPEYFQEELERVKERKVLDIDAISSYLRNNGQKNTQVYLPIIFLGGSAPCSSYTFSSLKANEQLFFFNKKNISGSSFFTITLNHRMVSYRVLNL